VENIKIIHSHRKIDADDAVTRFFSNYRPFYTVCCPRVTHVQGVVLRRIRGRGHFRSRDKDGINTIRSAISENPMLYANFTALSSTEPELLPIDFFA